MKTILVLLESLFQDKYISQTNFIGGNKTPCKMNKIRLNLTLILLFIVLFNNQTFSQWGTQTYVSTNVISKIKFTDKEHGWILANNEIFRTIDGGLLWSKSATLAVVDFQFVTNNLGFATNGTNVYKSTDGGFNWALIATVNFAYAKCIYFTSETIGFLLGQYIYKTTDGGQTWNSVYNPYYDINCVSSYGSSIFAGAGASWTYAYRSTDGGLNWQELNVAGSWHTTGITSISVINANTVFASNSGKIYKTADGGNSWSEVNTPPFYPNKTMFINASTGWAIGVGNQVGYNLPLVVSKTIDGGMTWTQQFIKNNPNSYTNFSNGLFVVDSSNIWCGGRGEIYTNTGIISIKKPTPGEVYWGNKPNTITWDYFNIKNVRIEYSTNGGSTWQSVEPNTPTSSKIYNWNTPPTLSQNCKLRFTDINNNVRQFVSQTFNIGGVKLTAPNGGESWKSGSPQTITWASVSVSNVKLEYTYDNGTSWQTIIPSTPASNNSFNWPTANTPSNNCRIRISDASNTTINDQSDGSFTVQGVKVLTPNGGETWKIGNKQSITWMAGGVSNIKLEYSVNNGTTWQNINSSVPAANQIFNWPIPSSVSTHCLVRISDASDVLVIDQSDNVFTIYLGRPNLLLPINNVTGQPVTLTCKWNKVSGAQTYQLQVSTDQNFISNVIINLPGIADTLKIINGLSNKTKYYWRVVASNTSGVSEFSDSFNFTTVVAFPLPPVPTSPVNNSVDQAVSNLLFNWNPSTDASSYHLQIATDFNFITGIYYKDSTLTTTSKVINGLANFTDYYWRVRAKNIAGISQWSLIMTFKTIPPVPIIPILLEPLNNSVNMPFQSFRLGWTNSPYATSYQVQVSEDLNFTTLFLDKLVSDIKYYIRDLSQLKTYYWKVRAINAAGTSQYSSTYKFTTGNVTGTKEVELKDKVLIYPNPAADFINIEGLGSGKFNLFITTITGKKIKQVSGNSINLLDVSELQNGMYLIIISNFNGFTTRELVICR